MMRNRFALMLTGALAMAALLLVTVAPAAAQTSTAPAKTTAKGYTPPRLADGHPDLQGTYDLATLTPVDRPRGQNATMTPEEAKKLEAASAKHRVDADAKIAGDRTAPPKGGDGSV